MAAGKIFVVDFNGEQHLVRALTQRGATRGLVQTLFNAALATTRPASQDDLIELVQKGVKVIDVTAGEPADAGSTGEPDAAAA